MVKCGVWEHPFSTSSFVLVVWIVGCFAQARALRFWACNNQQQRGAVATFPRLVTSPEGAARGT